MNNNSNWNGNYNFFEWYIIQITWIGIIIIPSSDLSQNFLILTGHYFVIRFVPELLDAGNSKELHKPAGILSQRLQEDAAKQLQTRFDDDDKYVVAKQVVPSVIIKKNDNQYVIAKQVVLSIIIKYNSYNDNQSVVSKQVVPSII